jgi:hypothetical protein
MLALDPDAGEATHKTLQLFGRKHGGDPVCSLLSCMGRGQQGRSDLRESPLLRLRQKNGMAVGGQNKE